MQQQKPINSVWRERNLSRRSFSRGGKKLQRPKCLKFETKNCLKIRPEIVYLYDNIIPALQVLSKHYFPPPCQLHPLLLSFPTVAIVVIANVISIIIIILPIATVVYLIFLQQSRQFKEKKINKINKNSQKPATLWSYKRLVEKIGQFQK